MPPPLMYFISFYYLTVQIGQCLKHRLDDLPYGPLLVEPFAFVGLQEQVPAERQVLHLHQ